MLVMMLVQVMMVVVMVAMLWSCHKFSNLEQKVVSYQHDFQIGSMREHIICIFENPPLPLSAILQKLNLRLAFIHSHLICLIFTQGRDVVYMKHCLKSWWRWFIAVLEKSPKVKLSIYINVFLRWVWGSSFTDGKRRRHTQSPIISDNDGVWNDFG